MKFSSRALSAAAAASPAEIDRKTTPQLSRLVLLFLASASCGRNVAKAAPGDCFSAAGDDLFWAVRGFVVEGCSTNSTCNTMTTWGPIEDWCTSQVTSFAALFADGFYGIDMKSFNEDISRWDVTAVKDFTVAFGGAAAFNQDLSSWQPQSATSVDRMFYGASSFNADISTWGGSLSNAASRQLMFSGATAFNQDLSSWDFSGVVSLSGFFRDATAFNQDISSWNVSLVTDTSGMFDGARSFNQDISGWEFRSGLNLTQFMFRDAVAFKQNISTWSAYGIVEPPTISTLFEKEIDMMSIDEFTFQWYPDWNGDNKGCIQDGEEPDYMKVSPESFLFETKEECCDAHFSWGFSVCMGTKFVSSMKFFPDFDGANEGCLADEGSTVAPEWMRSMSEWMLFDTVEECCDRHYSWSKAACMKNSGT